MDKSIFTEALQELFPLPLATFEKMMLHDDRASHPMTCGADFTFDGHFDRPKLESAVSEACLRHPLFCANVAHGMSSGWQWIPATDVPHVQWLNEEESIDDQRSAPIDLRTQVGLQIRARQLRSSTKLHFDFHHACADGAGGLAFIEDMLHLYAESLRPDRAQAKRLSPPNYALLRRRATFRAAGGPVKQRLSSEVSNLKSSCGVLFQRPTPLEFSQRPRLKTFGASPPPRLVSHHFDEGLLRELRFSAAHHEATVNDLLIRALLLTLRDWNRQTSKEDSDDRLRILMPMNLRNRADLLMPAANRMSYGFITRNVSQLACEETLLQGISRESIAIRRNQFARRAMGIISLIRALPGGFETLLSSKRCLATAVLSNVGDPTRRFRTRFPRDGGKIVVGNVRLREFSAITPVRPLTRASFFVNSYANQLSVGLRVDPTVVSAVDSEALLNQFAQQVIRTAVAERKLARAA